MSTVWEHDENGGAVTELTEAECWEALRSSEVFRLAYHLAGEVQIVPITAVVDGERLVFRTAEGSKLLGVHMTGDVAVEVDELVDDVATSVIARGPARELSGEDEERAATLPLAPWSPTWKNTFVAVEVSSVTGRRFKRSRPS